MTIVDGQIHLWAKGTPSAHHRQTPYSEDQALAGIDEAGIDRAVIHPVMWDPDSNELAVEAAMAAIYAIVCRGPLRRPGSESSQ
jgi:predicted TIM-barrel fold metal-dependent hydrolase